MKRWMVLAGLAAVGALACTASAPEEAAEVAEAPAPEMVVGVEQVRDNLYMLTGGGGNTAVFIGAEGVTVVDTKLAGWGQPILDAIAGLTDLPVTTIINTHTHFDHVSGNVEFPEGVEVVAQENTASNMEAWRGVTGLGDPPPNVFAESGGRGLATRTYSDALTLGEGDERIDLHYFGRAHTNGDSWVVFPALGVMHAGDSFAAKGVPIMDANNGGSGVDFPATIAAVVAGVTGVDTIITGHSTTMTMADLAEFGAFTQAVLDHVRAGKAAGQSVEEIVGSWQNPEAFADYGVDRLPTAVEVIFNELP